MKLVKMFLAGAIGAALTVLSVLSVGVFLGAREMSSYPPPIGPIALTVNDDGDQVVIVDVCRFQLLGITVRRAIDGGEAPVGTWRLAAPVKEGRVELNLAHPSTEWSVDGPERLDMPDTTYVIDGWGDDDDLVTSTISATTQMLRSLDPSQAIVGYEDIGPMYSEAEAPICPAR